jgi:hypothetical protein
MDQPAGFDPIPVLIPGNIRVQGRVVMHDHHAIGGHADIEFEGRHAKGSGSAEPFQRILREKRPSAAVALDAEW